jgi:hypothetical protein
MGLLSEEQFLSSRNALRAVVGRPEVRAWWQTERLEMRKSFAKVVDEEIAELPDRE